MEIRQPSQTAIDTAFWRALQILLDDEPKILADPYARDFAGFATDEELIRARDAHPLAHVLLTGMHSILRNRYAEDELVKAIEDGVTQYVILAAGLDSFAYRRRDLMQRLDVYEVDHAASQAWKQARVAALGIAVPNKLHYVPVDFEHETLADGLRRSPLRRKEKTFFSLLGVTQYLTLEALEHTLSDVTNAACPGSKLVISFVAPPASLPSDDAALVHAIAAGASKVGEPWLSYFDSADMEHLLRRKGFSNVEHLGPEGPPVDTYWDVRMMHDCRNTSEWPEPPFSGGWDEVIRPRSLRYLGTASCYRSSHRGLILTARNRRPRPRFQPVPVYRPHSQWHRR